MEIRNVQPAILPRQCAFTRLSNRDQDCVKIFENSETFRLRKLVAFDSNGVDFEHRTRYFPVANSPDLAKISPG